MDASCPWPINDLFFILCNLNEQAAQQDISSSHVSYSKQKIPTLKSFKVFRFPTVPDLTMGKTSDMVVFLPLILWKLVPSKMLLFD